MRKVIRSSLVKKYLALAFCLAFGVLFVGSAAHADGCVNLAGVPGTCRDIATQPPVADEIATSGSGAQATTYQQFWGGMISGCSINQTCYVKQGDTLCKALAQRAGKTGAFACSATCSNNTLDPAQGPPFGGACPSGKTCCVPGAPAGASGGGGGAGAVALPDPLSGANIPQIIGNMIRTVMGICGSIALLMFVFGGIQYIMSGGDAKKAASAMMYIRNATIGLILIFGAYAISSVIFDALLTTQ